MKANLTGTKRLALALAVFCAAACTPPSLPAAQYSKLGIITAAKSAGKWTALRAWIDASGFADEWAAAAFLSDTYPAFAAITNAVAATGIATPDEIAAILSAARDTAPDALLSSVYARDMATDAGRRKWHGERRAQFVLADPPMRIDVYADGYAHTNRAARASTPDPEASAKAAAELAAWEAANLPPELAALRAAQRAAAATQTVVVVTSP